MQHTANTVSAGKQEQHISIFNSHVKWINCNNTQMDTFYETLFYLKNYKPVVKPNSSYKVILKLKTKKTWNKEEKVYKSRNR